MKSYTFDDYDSKEFINSFHYDEERNLIVIHYASGKLLPTNCTKENLKKILEKMKNQVENSQEFEIAHKRKLHLAIFMSSLSILVLLSIFIVTNPSFFLVILSLLTLYLGVSIINGSMIMLRDIKKNKLFLENSDEINKCIKSLTSEELSNMIENNILKSVTNENDKLLYMEYDIPPVNLNSIDNSTLEEVEDLVKTLHIKPKRKK